MTHDDMIPNTYNHSVLISSTMMIIEGILQYTIDEYNDNDDINDVC
jgi:hypothetical protein